MISPFRMLIMAWMFISFSSFSQSSLDSKPLASVVNNNRQSNLDTVLIDKMMNRLATMDHQIHSILVLKSGHLIFEEYFNDYDASKRQDWRSVSKSIYSLLMGIAIDQGFVKSLDDPFLNYISYQPEKNIDDRKEAITIRHLLTMSSGLDCNDWDKTSAGQEDRIYKSKDWIQKSLDLEMVRNPGDSSLYCTAGVTLMAEVISQATGMDVDEFASKYLFEPLDITNYHWGHTSSKKSIPASAKRIYMTPGDMMKIGQLVLNEGTWKNVQIISKEWIQMATSPQTRLAGVDYGFLWWQIPIVSEEKTYRMTCATGNGGQYILIFDELDMIVVFTGGAYNSEKDKFPFAIIRDIFLPAINNDL